MNPDMAADPAWLAALAVIAWGVLIVIICVSAVRGGRRG